MIKLYLIYCLVAAILSVLIAVVVWDFIFAYDGYIVVPGYIVPAEPPVTT